MAESNSLPHCLFTDDTWRKARACLLILSWYQSFSFTSCCSSLMRYMSTHSLQARTENSGSHTCSKKVSRPYVHTYICTCRVYVSLNVISFYQTGDCRARVRIRAAIIAGTERGKHVIAAVCNSTTIRGRLSIAGYSRDIIWVRRRLRWFYLSPDTTLAIGARSTL